MVAASVAPMNDNTSNKSGRWGNWMVRAKTCFKAASAIDAGATTVHAALKELEPQVDSTQAAMLTTLREAEAALARARDAVQAALKARQLTAQNREVAYGLV